MSKSVKVLVYSAMCVALATVTGMIKLFSFPTGGSLTLCSMLFGALPGYFFGPLAGLCAGAAYGLLQFIMEPYFLTPVQVVLDYGAFAVLGLCAGLFSTKKNGLKLGYLAGCAGRWLCSFLSGWIFFGEYAWEGWGAAPYSAVYNIIYIGAEAVITFAILSVTAVTAAINKVKSAAGE